MLVAGAAGLYGFDRIGNDAAALEDAILAKLDRQGAAREVMLALDRLIATMESEWSAPGSQNRQALSA